LVQTLLVLLARVQETASKICEGNWFQSMLHRYRVIFA
jgi:hypothetical protein